MFTKACLLHDGELVIAVTKQKPRSEPTVGRITVEHADAPLGTAVFTIRLGSKIQHSFHVSAQGGVPEDGCICPTPPLLAPHYGREGPAPVPHVVNFQAL
jgi:hypothetical protein